MKKNTLVLALTVIGVSAGTAHAQQPPKTYMKSSQVPAYKLVQKNKKVQDIPKLNLSAEKDIVANIKPLNIPEAGVLKLNPVVRKQSPALLNIATESLQAAPAAAAKALTSQQAIQNIPDLKVLNEVAEPQLD